MPIYEKPSKVYDIESGGKEVTGPLPSSYRQMAEVTNQSGQKESWMGIPSPEEQVQQNNQPQFEDYSNVPPEIQIDKFPEETYKIGRMEIENELAMSNNEAARWKLTNPETATFLIQNANNIAQMKMNELNQNRSKAKISFKQIDMAPKLSPEERYLMKTEYLNRNPIYEMNKIEIPKQDFKFGNVQKTMSELEHGGIIDNSGYMKEFLDRDTMMAYAEQNLPQDIWPQAIEVINKRFPQENVEQESEQKVQPIIGKSGGKQKYTWPTGYYPSQPIPYKGESEGKTAQQTSQIPHPSLTKYWFNLPNDEKTEISLALKKDPNNLNIILGRLQENK